jgi:tripartite motif-containing protein 71
VFTLIRVSVSIILIGNVRAGTIFVRTKVGESRIRRRTISEPTRIAIDSTDNVYVLDSGQNSAQKFSGNGTFVTKWGSSGSSSGQFSNPVDIVLDPVDNIYVLDKKVPAVKKFSSDGELMTGWGNIEILPWASLEGNLLDPSSLAVSPSGKVYITDRNLHLIRIFTIDGNPVESIGSNGIEDGQFSFPGSIAFDDSGNFYNLSVPLKSACALYVSLPVD